MEGKIVTVINRSEIVGRPLAAMLANDGAEVYSVDINSIYRLSGGRLYPCDETPESCVRKVRTCFDVDDIVGQFEFADAESPVPFSSFYLLVFGNNYRCSDQRLSSPDRMDSAQYDGNQRGVV
jgi:hypothetical protein